MFHEITPYEIPGNVFERIFHEWFLITAQKPDGTVNTMTAAWGGMGINFGVPSIHCYVRPHRYTYEFTEACERMTFCFFGDGCREELEFLGSRSGRDGDKIAASGLTPITEGDVTYFAEAKLVIVGRRRYTATVENAHFDRAEDRENQYPDGAPHRVYVCDIERVLQADE